MITPSFGLTATERVLPSMALDFTTASLDSRVTFTRSGATATVVNSSGLIAYVAANTPRFDFDPTTLVCKGLLIEEARTNIVIQSDALQSGAYATSNATVGTNAVVSPDGTLNAETVTAGAVGTGLIFGINALLPVTPATNYTVSFYAKNISATYVVYGVLQATPTAAWIVDIANPANNYVSQINSSTWTRITFSFNSGTATSINLYMAANIPATQSLSIWGVQLEAGTFATSYIRTTGSQVTRTADTAVMTGTNFSSWYNASEGTFTAQYLSFATSGFPDVLNASDGTNNNRLNVFIDGSNGFTTTSELVAGVQQGVCSFPTTQKTTIRASFAYSSAGVSAAVNGTATVVGNNVTHPSGLNKLSLGNSAAGVNNFLNGYLAKFAFYSQRLISAELQAFSK